MLYRISRAQEQEIFLVLLVNFVMRSHLFSEISKHIYVSILCSEQIHPLCSQKAAFQARFGAFQYFSTHYICLVHKQR